MAESKNMGAQPENITAPNKKRSGIALAGFTLGILSLLLWLFPLLGFIVSIVGIILSAMTRTQKYGKSGLILNIIGLVLAIIATAIGAYLASIGLYYF